MIEEAHVTAIEGQQRKVTNFGFIRPEAVEVRFRDGRRLNADHLQDCRLPHIVVRADKIEADTSARPTHAPHFGTNEG